jgi:hypothetical protein
VHVEDGGEPAAALARREREVAVHLEPVARRERERLHPGEREPGEGGLVLEQEARLPAVAVVGVVANGAVVVRVRRQPDPV